MSAAEPWWWLSFVDETRPKGQQSLGVAIVQAPDFASAVVAAHMLDINPGGEVAGAEIPLELVPDPENRCRLLSPGDARELAAAIDRRNRER